MFLGGSVPHKERQKDCEKTGKWDHLRLIQIFYIVTFWSNLSQCLVIYSLQTLLSVEKNNTRDLNACL